MRVLAIDTALDACQAAVVADGRTLAARSEPMQRGHQERLAPMVQQVMAEAGVAFEALDRLAVTVGPGSFTGLRVGLAFAKGVALALDIPCLGVGALEALAWSVDAPRIAAAIEARGQGVYWQRFEARAPLAPPTMRSIAWALEELSGWERPVRLVGPGAALLDGAASLIAPAVLTPDIVALARGAARASPDAYPPAPLYLRAPEAKTIAERTAARA